METPFVQDNYLRLNSLIKKAVPPVVREVFEKYFQDPFQQTKILHRYARELEAMKNLHIISAFEWKLLFPSFGRLNSYNCGTSLLISLLEYIVFKNGSDGTLFFAISCSYRPPMTRNQLVIAGQGFEKDLPPNKDVSVRADLRRIKWIRNFMENEMSEKMSNKDFQQYWENISGALERLGGPEYIEICAQMKGPDELSRHLELIPTDRQLRRFAIQLTKDDFRKLMIYLGMDYSRIEQIFDEHRRLHDAMFYCLWNWKGSAINPSFSALKTALEMSDLTSDYLHKMFEMNTVVGGVPTNLQDVEPTETFLIQLSRGIGKEVFQLAIELELSVPDYEDIEYNYGYTNLPEQAYAVLRKWKQSNNSPTVIQLVNAMRRINRVVIF